MVTDCLTRTAEQLRRAVLLERAEEFSDGSLLDRFLADRDAAAFEVLVRRHGPMVLGVCRRILGNAADADDAFQATFLVLLRKADCVRPRDRVGPWLHGVAYRTASKARGLMARRRVREQPLADRPVDYVPNFEVRDWLPLLDRELNRLPEKYRTVVVLCDLQGLSRHDAATHLQLSAGTLSSRLARGRAILGDRLKRRGVALSAVLLAISQAATASVPQPLVARTCEMAAGRAICANINVLTHGVLQAMVVSKLLKCVTAAAIVAGVGLGLGMRGFVEEARAEKPAAADKPVKPEANANAAEKPPVGATFSGTVKSTDAKKKTVTVVVPLNNGTKETKEETHPLADNAEILLEHGPKKGEVKKTETKPGTIANLTEGTPVTIQLTVDGKAIAKINVRGGSLHGSVKSIDINKKTITVQTKTKSGAEEKTVTLIEDAKIVLDDGLGDKKKPAPPKEGKFADLTDGTMVFIQLSGADRTQALGVVAVGPSASGSVQSVDAGNNTITIQVKEDGAVVDKTYTVHKDARINVGKLGDIQQGKRANLRLSIEDKKTVVGINVAD